MAHSIMLTNWFVNDNKPPHHYVVKGDSGNFESGTLVLVLNSQGSAPNGLKQGEKYYVGSDEKNFPDSEFKGADHQMLYFRPKN